MANVLLKFGDFELEYDPATYRERKNYKVDTLHIPRKDGVEITDLQKSDALSIEISGSILKATKEEARDRLYEMQRAFNKGKQKLYIYDDRYTFAQVNNFEYEIVSATEGSILNYTVEFICPEPFWYGEEIEIPISSPSSFEINSATSEGNTYSPIVFEIKRIGSSTPQTTIEIEKADNTGRIIEKGILKDISLNQNDIIYINSEINNIFLNNREIEEIKKVLDFPFGYGQKDSMEVYNNNLYIAYNDKLYKYDGVNLSVIWTGFDVRLLKVYQGNLYFTNYDTISTKIYKYDGTNISLSYDTLVDYQIRDAIEIFNNKLYVAVGNRVYQYDGTTWSLVATFGTYDNQYITELKTYQGYLIAFIYSNTPMLTVYTTQNGLNWTGRSNLLIECAEVYYDRLYMISIKNPYGYPTYIYWTDDPLFSNINTAFTLGNEYIKTIYNYNNYLYFTREDGILCRTNGVIIENIDEIFTYAGSMIKWNGYLYILTTKTTALYKAMYPVSLLRAYQGDFFTIDLGQRNFFNTNIFSTYYTLKLYYKKRWL
ncbi:MAG: phage tail family protein [Thermoplasmata archaeon]